MNLERQICNSRGPKPSSRLSLSLSPFYVLKDIIVSGEYKYMSPRRDSTQPFLLRHKHNNRDDWLTMRMSCNGCRVLRKGCSDSCAIRPCLEWIRSPDAQANATVFLAKFYGRAGLVNLINAGPPNLRPAILRSLLYEACGRIVNPISGSVGLLWSGSWNRCQDAVDAVLEGSPIADVVSDAVAEEPQNLKAYDIRHVSKKEKKLVPDSSNALNQVRSRRRFKRSGACPKRRRVSLASPEKESSIQSHGSSLSHQSAAEMVFPTGSCPSSSEPTWDNDDAEMDLSLTLGLEPTKPCVKTNDHLPTTSNDGACKMNFRLHFPAP